jgi:hypothetical protein
MKMKKTVAIILAGLGILLPGAAETLADVVTQGFYQADQFNQTANFSGNNLTVSITSTSGGAIVSQVFTTGIVDARFGPGGGTPLIPAAGSIQVPNDSCTFIFSSTGSCGGVLRFTNNPVIPIGPPNMPNGVFAGDAPFTMTGDLVTPTGTTHIEMGSGFVHAQCTPSGPFCLNSFARYDFAVAEPSTVVLVLSGLVAFGWSRWRGGKRAGSS